MTTCSVAGCKRPVFLDDWCYTHYAQWQDYGDPLIEEPPPKPKRILPSVFYGNRCGCGKRSHSRGMCPSCYSRWRQTNHPEGLTCSECDRPLSAKGLCRRHYARVYEAAKRVRRLAGQVETFTHQEIFDRDNWQCGICGHPVDPALEWPHPKSASLDHIIPISEQPIHTRANVRLAHLSCNCSRWTGTDDDPIQLRLVD